jgi:cation diffusion facilitator family transporter
MAQDSGILRALRMTIVVYFIIFFMKIVVYFFSGVMALLAEALHTLSDIFISGFLYAAAAIWSKKDADEVHMFGHGRAENIAGLVAATLFISFTSFRLYEEAIPRLIWPEERTYQNLDLVLGVLVVSMVIAAVPIVNLFRNKMKGAAAKAQYMELINDELGLLAALIGSIFIMEKEPLADPIATIVVATIIAINAANVFRENSTMLLGHGPGPEFVEKVHEVAMGVKGVKGVHTVKAEYIGTNTVVLGMHIEVTKGTPIEQADAIAEAVRKRLHKKVKAKYCYIHIDPEQKRHPDGSLCGDPLEDDDH